MFKFSNKQIKAIKNATECEQLNKIDREILTQILGSSFTENTEDGLDDKKTSLEFGGSYNKAELFVDGASDLKTNTAGIGGVIYFKGEEIITFSDPLYHKTNNEAEYLSLIKGIDVVLSLKIKNICIYADSQLVVRQVNGLYKVKNMRMRELHETVSKRLKKISKWEIKHIRREGNKRADELSKIGLKNAKRQKS